MSQPNPEKVARVAAETLSDLDAAIPVQPGNVVPFVKPKKTTLPYPVQIVADGLHLLQGDDWEDQLQFTMLGWKHGHPPTFCVSRDELSVTSLPLIWAQTFEAHTEGYYRRLAAQSERGLTQKQEG